MKRKNRDQEPKRATFIYENYKKEVSLRTVVPVKFYWGSTSYYPKEQWLLEARDIDKKAMRIFALKNIRCWVT